MYSCLWGCLRLRVDEFEREMGQGEAKGMASGIVHSEKNAYELSLNETSRSKRRVVDLELRILNPGI
jgi:hypothetical protein